MQEAVALSSGVPAIILQPHDLNPDGEGGICDGAAPTSVSSGNKVVSPDRLHVSCISTAFQLPFLARGGYQQDQRSEMLRLDASHMPARSMTLRYSQHLEYISMAVNGSE
ncbi:hypothetical protein Q7C36_003511 [Tachysurus vachellii]|uniref:Uncharacterized protein n=1 Tax=Tachysurus vachellii TaxID=175792 RepID=A0AA88T525_TACVA|nr:hypothetical protein Q7C36_003511 [Tachysurus vachellii]